jgi:hypothetical protein
VTGEAWAKACTLTLLDQARAGKRDFAGILFSSARPAACTSSTSPTRPPSRPCASWSAASAPAATCPASRSPDQAEMREMIIAAFTTKSRDDPSKLAADIATATRDGAREATVNVLYERFRDLHSSTTEHATLLNTSLDDTTAALQLVNAQLASLLAKAS